MFYSIYISIGGRLDYNLPFPPSPPTTISSETMAGRRHVVSVRERKSYDEIIRLATAAPSNVTVGINSPTTPGPSTTTTPLEFEAASCSKNKEREREREREKEGAVGVGAGAGVGLKRLLGDKISSLTSGGTINSNASNAINNTNTNINTNTDDQHALLNQSITPGSLALSSATTLAQGTSTSIASTLLGSTTMASPPMASSMQSSKLHASPSKVCISLHFSKDLWAFSPYFVARLFFFFLF